MIKQGILSQTDKLALDNFFVDISTSPFGEFVVIERIERRIDEDGNDTDIKRYVKGIYAKLINKEIKEYDPIIGGIITRGDLMIIIRDGDKWYNNTNLLSKDAMQDMKIEIFVKVKSENYIITKDRLNPDNTISLTLRKYRS